MTAVWEKKTHSWQGLNRDLITETQLIKLKCYTLLFHQKSAQQFQSIDHGIIENNDPMMINENEK